MNPVIDTEAERLAAINRKLADALTQALMFLFVAGKEPPYYVPSHIDGDLWRRRPTLCPAEATNIIKGAVRKAQGGNRP